jgi:hypothetical protein
MAAISWSEIRGQRFTDEEAREASDFREILDNFNLEPDRAFDLLQKEQLTVAKRLVLAEMAPLDRAVVILLNESDARIRAVIQNRIQEDRLSINGGIIC